MATTKSCLSVTGRPLFIWLRDAPIFNGNARIHSSRIGFLLEKKYLHFTNATKKGTAEEVLWRYIRRHPNSILACDQKTRSLFLRRYGARDLPQWSYASNGIGFLQAETKSFGDNELKLILSNQIQHLDQQFLNNDTSTLYCKNGVLLHITDLQEEVNFKNECIKEAIKWRDRKYSKPKWKKILSTAPLIFARSLILSTELEGLLHGKARILRSQNRRAEKHSGNGRILECHDVSSNQQRSGIG